MIENTLYTAHHQGGGTGPGAQVPLVSIPEDNKAFYGEVSPTDLITGSSLASLVGLTTGINKTDIDTTSWFKFALDDKILFVAKRCFKYNIAWDDINNVNCVDGIRTIIIGTNQYKIQLTKGVAPDTTGITWSNGTDPPISYGSEWNRLMYNLLPEQFTGYQASQVGPDWANYLPADVNASGNGAFSWCQEPWSNTTSRIYRGSSSLSSLGLANPGSPSNSLGWRPVLELIV